MNSLITFFIRMIVSVPVTFVTFLVSLFAFDQSFWTSTAIGIGGGIIVYWGLTTYIKVRFLKKHGLTRKEYRYISKSLSEAKPKINRLNRALLSIRYIPSFKDRVELVKITRKIYKLTKNEPRRFYLAERFYFSHLESALELAEKYVFLSGQPKKNQEVELALYETRKTLEELKRLIEDDLYKVISKDMDKLDFELDVAKYSIRSKKDKKDNESRDIK